MCSLPPAAGRARGLALALLGLAALAAPSAGTAAPALRAQVELRGDFALVGNTLARDCAGGVPAPVVGTTGACGSSTSDSGVDVFWRVDPATGAATSDRTVTLAQASSAAVLQLPAGAAVRYARAYWGANASGTGFDAAASLRLPDGTTATLTAEPAASRTATANGSVWYQSSADVTALLAALAEPRGAYTLSGFDSRSLVGTSSETLFAAWWLVVFYEDPADPTVRQITLFDGLEAVASGAPAQVSLAGFRVPQGGFDAKLGVVAYEGDAVVTGDSFEFRAYAAPAAPPSSLAQLADAQNPAGNFFNGTRSWLGAPVSRTGDLPQLGGGPGSMSSFDLDVVDLKANGAIAAGDDAAVIRATSSGDIYALGGFVTSIATYRPSFLDTVKSVRDLTRTDGVLAGDRLEYTVVARNGGNDTAVGTTLLDPLAAGLILDPGSVRIDGSAAGSLASYDAAARLLTVWVGAGATAGSGGSVPPGGAVTVTFEATLAPGTSGTISNQATLVAAGLQGDPATAFLSHPPADAGPTSFPVDACVSDAQCGGTTPVCDVGPTPNACVGCLADAHCGGATPICDLTALRCVGRTTLAPAGQEKATVAGAAAPFALVLASNLLAAERYDLVVWGGGCSAEVRDGQGAPLGDANGNGLGDLAVAAGGAAAFTVHLTPPADAPVDTTCAALVTATGEGSGLVARASATLRVAPPVRYGPDHVGAGAQVVSSGGTTLFAGTITNAGAAAASFDLAAVIAASPAAGPLGAAVFYSDPDGDGDPADGAPISGTGPVPPFGGSVHVVLAVPALTAGGVPLPAGTALAVTATASAGGALATQRDEAQVGFLTASADAAQATTTRTFAPCDAVHVAASHLPSGPTYALEWYAGESPARGADLPRRAVDPWPVTGGVAGDALALPGDAAGAWTLLLVQHLAGGDVVLDTLRLTVERSGAVASLTAADLVLGGALQVSAALRSDNAGAPLRATQVTYRVEGGGLALDGAGAFVAPLAAAHLTSGLDLGPGATRIDGFTRAAPAWPAAGVYQVTAEWELACSGGPPIAMATTELRVAPPAPAIDAPAAGALLATRTPAVSGRGRAGASVALTADGAPAGSATVDAGGRWSLTLATPLADGARLLSATQVEGGVASSAAEVGVTVDATPPPVAIASPAAGALLGAAAAPGGQVTVSGTAEAGATVRVSLGGQAAEVAAASGSFAVTLSAADGPLVAQVTATDAAGNVATASASFTLDTTPPAAPAVGAPAADGLLGAAAMPGGQVLFAGSAEPGARVELAVDGAAPVLAARSGDGFTASLPLDDGPHALAAVAIDAAGNASPPTLVAFRLDTEPPAAPALLSPLAGATLGAAEAPAGRVVVSGTAEAGSLVTVVLGAETRTVAAGSGTFSAAFDLADGAQVAQAVAADGAGNLSVPALLFFSLDTAAPGAPVLASLPAVTRLDEVPVSGSAEPGAAVLVLVDGAAVATATASADGSFRVLVPLAEGSHAVQVEVRDGAGNAAPVPPPASVRVDRTAPAAPVIDGPGEGAEVAAGEVAVTGSAEPGASVSVSLDGGAPLVVAAGADGRFSVAFPVGAGAHALRAVAMDEAGNASAASSRAFAAVDPGAGGGGSGGGGGTGGGTGGSGGGTGGGGSGGSDGGTGSGGAGGGTAGSDPGASPKSSGCGCGSGSEPAPAAAVLIALLALAPRRRAVAVRARR